MFISFNLHYFKNNKGSIAARGKIDEPMKSCSYVNNLIEQAELHASFWDVFEASGGVLNHFGQVVAL